MWGVEQADVLRNLFSELNRKNLRWMVLRNYEGLPDFNRSKDVDLLFDKRDFLAVEDILYKTLNSCGFLYVKKEVFQYAWCFTFFKIDKSSISSIKIDLLDGFVWKGAQVISFDEVYQERVEYKDFYVPNEIYDGFMLWVKPLLTGGFIKEKYKSDIYKSFFNNQDAFKRILEDKFGDDLSKKVIEYFLDRDLEKTVKLHRKLAYRVWIRSLKKGAKSTLINSIEHYYIEIKRRLKRPNGSFISVAGPDGVGKTTFINELSNNLSNIFLKDIDNIYIFHFRPKIFPNIKKLFYGRRFDESKENFNKPHRAKPVSGINACIRLVYYYMDYLIGYFIKIRRLCINSNFVIFDRYFYDFIIDPHRSRIDIDIDIRKFFWTITPKPDLIFILVADNNIIYSRKQELTLEEIKRQLKEYRLFSLNNGGVILDTSNNLDTIIHDALKEIIINNTLLISDLR